MTCCKSRAALSRSSDCVWRKRKRPATSSYSRGRVRVDAAQSPDARARLLDVIIQSGRQLVDDGQLGDERLQWERGLIGKTGGLLHIGEAEVLADLASKALQAVFGSLQGEPGGGPVGLRLQYQLLPGSLLLLGACKVPVQLLQVGFQFSNLAPVRVAFGIQFTFLGSCPADVAAQPIRFLDQLRLPVGQPLKLAVDLNLRASLVGFERAPVFQVLLRDGGLGPQVGQLAEHPVGGLSGRPVQPARPVPGRRPA